MSQFTPTAEDPTGQRAFSTPHHMQAPQSYAQAESKQERYARQTRNATVFIAWALGIWLAISLILGIIIGINVAKLGGGVSTGPTSAICQVDPSYPGC